MAPARVAGDMVRAYVTITTRAGTSRDLVGALRALDAVRQADIVAGEFDIVAQVEADTEHDLLVLVTDAIQGLEGVGRTSTCIVLE